MAQLYAANFLAPPKLRKPPLDVFGNLRVPMIEALNSTTADKDGWIPRGNSTIYASLIGVPLEGVPLKGNSTFTIESNYAYLDCRKPKLIGELPSYLNHFPTGSRLGPTFFVNMSEQD